MPTEYTYGALPIEIGGVSKAILYVQPSTSYPIVTVNLVVLESNGHIVRWNDKSAEVTDVPYSNELMNIAFDWLTSHYSLPDGYEEWNNDGALESDTTNLQSINCIDW